MKKNKLILSFTIIITISISVFIYFLSVYNRETLIIQNANKQIDYSQNIFNTIKTRDIGAMSAVLDGILLDKGYKDLFLKKDREGLFSYSQPLFKEIEKDYEITHFYFHLPDATNFVRIHDKTKFDDKINRLTFKQAVGSQVIGSGIELGQTAFALRVVKPYYDKGKLIGYIELGQEIGHFLDILKENTNSNYSIFVNKSALNKDSWKSVRESAGLSTNWDSFKNLVEMGSTINTAENKDAVSGCLNEANAQTAYDIKDKNKEYLGGTGINIFCGSFDLLDASNNKIGVVLMSLDIASDLALINSFIYQQIIFIIIFLVIVFFILYYVSKRNLVAEKKYKYLFDGSEDAILTLIPPDWKFFDGNPSALKLFGLKNIEELKNISPSQVSPEHQPSGGLSSVLAKEMIEMALNKGLHSFEWVHKKITGQEFIASVLFTKIEINKKIILQAVVRDITEEKKSLELIKKANDETKNSLLESEKINKIMVGRELEMIKLKKEIEELKKSKS